MLGVCRSLLQLGCRHRRIRVLQLDLWRLVWSILLVRLGVGIGEVRSQTCLCGWLWLVGGLEVVDGSLEEGSVSIIWVAIVETERSRLWGT